MLVGTSDWSKLHSVVTKNRNTRTCMWLFLQLLLFYCQALKLMILICCSCFYVSSQLRCKIYYSNNGNNNNNSRLVVWIFLFAHQQKFISLNIIWQQLSLFQSETIYIFCSECDDIVCMFESASKNNSNKVVTHKIHVYVYLYVVLFLFFSSSSSSNLYWPMPFTLLNQNFSHSLFSAADTVSNCFR